MFCYFGGLQEGGWENMRARRRVGCMFYTGARGVNVAYQNFVLNHCGSSFTVAAVGPSLVHSGTGLLSHSSADVFLMISNVACGSARCFWCSRT